MVYVTIVSFVWKSFKIMDLNLRLKIILMSKGVCKHHHLVDMVESQVRTCFQASKVVDVPPPPALTAVVRVPSLGFLVAVHNPRAHGLAT